MISWWAPLQALPSAWLPGLLALMPSALTLWEHYPSNVIGQKYEQGYYVALLREGAHLGLIYHSPKDQLPLAVQWQLHSSSEQCNTTAPLFFKGLTVQHLPACFDGDVAIQVSVDGDQAPAVIFDMVVPWSAGPVG